ncbi:hypothetical protein AC1031_004388 [Aphanomyces cochlioides]|nr:hypothetical protein AC1031_004388 [Aphanomyces cochlioides]
MATRGPRTRSSMASDSSDLEPKRAPNLEGKPQAIRHKDTAPLPESPKANNTSPNPAEGSNTTPPKRIFLTRKTERRKSQTQSQPSQGSDSEIEFKDDVPASEMKNQAAHIGQLHCQMDKQAAELAEMSDRVVKYGQAIVQLSQTIEQLKLSAGDSKGSRQSIDLCGMMTTHGRPCRKSKARCPYRRGGTHPPQPTVDMGGDESSTASSEGSAN